jgi:hypothetical protein
MSNRLLAALLTTTAGCGAFRRPGLGQASATPNCRYRHDQHGGWRPGKGRGHRPQARGRGPGGADLHHRLSQADLDKLNVKTIEDLKYVSPSVYIAPTSFRQDTLNITIRGQRNFDAPGGGGNPGLAFDTASAVYKDGVYYARARGLTGFAVRPGQCRSSKGAAGHLWSGRNTTGGAILYNSRDPEAEFGGLCSGHGRRLRPRRGCRAPLTCRWMTPVFLRVALNSENSEGYSPITS